MWTKNFKNKVNIRDQFAILREYNRPLGTRILFIDDNTGNIIREEHNTMVVAGSQFTAQKHFRVEAGLELPNYNDELGIQNAAANNSTINEEYSCLFCCGTSGCGQTNDSVYVPIYHSRIHPDNLIPFRYEKKDNDLDSIGRQTYFGRKEIGDRVAYYYKKFDSTPQLFLRFNDGTQMDNTVYNVTTTTRRGYVLAEMRLKITKTDFRDWFKETDGSLNNARINTFSLLTAWESIDEKTGYTYYNDVRPLTQTNFTNEWLIDLGKSITIVYQIYY